MPKTNTPKLTDTQLVILSSASQRDDGLAIIPEKLKGGAAKAVVAKLLGLGFLNEIRVKRDQPAWRTDEKKPIGLKITKAGAAVIGASDEAEVGDKAAEKPKAARKPKKRTAKETTPSHGPRE